MIKLPETYAARMQQMLGSEYEAYLESLERPVLNGLRVNTLKTSPEAFMAKYGPLVTGPVAWCPEGFYVRPGEVPSKDPAYYAGLYYLQEPSAMTPASVLPVQPGERVLDLCAAPGGKSTQLLCKLKGQGLLVSNDISPSRAKALVKNLELFGGRNYCVTTEPPYKLKDRFPGFFHKILVDAPCSGEGMFHKEPGIMKNWEQYGTGYYAALQREILEHAADLLMPGGQMVYSTCTFSPQEDEQSLQDFLDAHPDFHLADIPDVPGFDRGHPEWIENGREELTKAVRLWPHKVMGEGHFVALLQKDGESEEPFPGPPQKDCKEAEIFFRWCAENLKNRIDLPNMTVRRVGDFLVADPLGEQAVKGIRVQRSGLLLGELKGDRFEPSQALAMSLTGSEAALTLDLKAGRPDVLRYLKGESLNVSFAKGWVLVTLDGHPLGWARGGGALLKNKYLRGWRYV